MTKTPLIEGRFTYHPETKQLNLTFTSGRTVTIFDPEFEHQVRGEVKIKHTGGSACKRSALTWAQQLEGQMDAEVKRTRSVITPEPPVRRFDKRGRLEVNLKDLDLDLTALLADLPSKKEDAA